MKKIILSSFLIVNAILALGQFSSEEVIATTSSFATSVASGDIDKDGDIDIVLGAGSGVNCTIYFCENIGAGNFAPPQIISSLPNGSSSVSLADIDNDGDLDALSASNNDDIIAWYENLGGGSFGVRQVIALGVIGASSVFAADMDNDGDMDVLSSAYTGDRIEWYENLGGGIFSSWKLVSNNTNGSFEVIAEDLDGDGDMDVISTSFNDNKLVWYENQGGGIIDTNQIFFTNIAAGSIWASTADINNDDLVDVLSATKSNNTASWYKNLGGGIFDTAQVITNQAMGIRSVMPCDIDDDGDQDIVTASQGDFEIAWHENLGNGIFGPEQLIFTNGVSQPSLAYPVDIDNDGDIDVVSCFFDGLVIVNKNQLYHNARLEGRLFVDYNQNAKLDSTEQGISQMKVLSNPLSDFSFTHPDGNYYLEFSDTIGNYQLFPQYLDYWELTTDSILYNVKLDTSYVARDSLNFGFYPDTLVSEISAELIGGFPRCNAIVNYWIDIHNIGSTIPSGLIHLELDSNIFYVNNINAPFPDSVVGHHVYWHYDSLFYFSNELIKFNVIMPASVNTPLISYVNVHVMDTNQNSIFIASDTLKQHLLCAHDPNDKTPTPLGVDSMGYIDLSTNEIEYLVRFQNTGNDTALSVTIEDKLDTNLLWQSLTILSHSHPMQASVDQNGKIFFVFNNIMLPDSGANELESHGYVKYKIQLKPNLPTGTSILNNVYIFFDYNPPVITNWAINTLFDCENIDFSDQLELLVCMNDSINGSIIDSTAGTTVIWDIPNVYNSIGNNFDWIADTAGTFAITVSSVNSLCYKDTVIQVIVLPELAISTIDTTELCFGDSILIFAKYQNQTGTYYDTLQSIYSCDSIIAKDLIINSVYSNIIDTAEICFGDSTLVFGSYQSQSGLYYDTLQSINSCDSILIKRLEILQPFVVTLNSFNPDTLCDNEIPVVLPIGVPNGGTYSGTGISGNNFDPNIAGQGVHHIYYSYTDSNLCVGIDSTQITVVSCVGIDELGNGVEIIISPNPFTNFTTIEFKEDLKGEYDMYVYDIVGKEIHSELKLTGNKFVLQQSVLGKGIYLINLVNNKTGRKFTRKVIAQ